MSRYLLGALTALKKGQEFQSRSLPLNISCSSSILITACAFSAYNVSLPFEELLLELKMRGIQLLTYPPFLVTIESLQANPLRCVHLWLHLRVRAEHRPHPHDDHRHEVVPQEEGARHGDSRGRIRRRGLHIQSGWDYVVHPRVFLVCV